MKKIISLAVILAASFSFSNLSVLFAKVKDNVLNRKTVALLDKVAEKKERSANDCDTICNTTCSD